MRNPAFVLSGLLSLCLGGCQPPPPPAHFLVDILPNDTVVSASSGLLDQPVDIQLLPGGVLEIMDAGTRAVIRIDPETGVVLSVDSTESQLNPPMPPVAALPDGGRWLVTDSVPRIQRLGSEGGIEVDRAITAEELTSIRTQALFRAESEGTSVSQRYATDLRIVAGLPWLLLNMTVQEGARILVFDSDGIQVGKLDLRATEGGRRFVVDTARATIYVASPNPPQLLSNSLRGYEFLWRNPDLQ